MEAVSKDLRGTFFVHWNVMVKRRLWWSWSGLTTRFDTKGFGCISLRGSMLVGDPMQLHLFAFTLSTTIQWIFSSDVCLHPVLFRIILLNKRSWYGKMKISRLITESAIKTAKVLNLICNDHSRVLIQTKSIFRIHQWFCACFMNR